MKIAIAHRWPLYLEGLASTLRTVWPEADFVLIDSRTLQDSIDVLTERQNDVIIGDFVACDDPDHSILRAVAIAARAVVVVASAVDGIILGDLLKAGAKGVILKSMEGEQVRSIVSLILAGLTCVPTEALEEFVAQSGGGDRAADGTLSGRDMAVLARLAKGATNKEIARDMEMSVSSVKLHVQSILRATEAANRTQAIVTARERGLIS